MMNATLASQPLGAGNKTPWHLWAVGGLTLLWNAVGGFSFTVTHLGMLADLGMTDVEISYFDSFPLWANVAWAMGVWGAIGASVLLLLRSRFAVHASIVAILGLIGSNTYQFAMTEVPESLQSLPLVALIWATTLFVLFYAMRMKNRHVLR